MGATLSYYWYGTTYQDVSSMIDDFEMMTDDTEQQKLNLCESKNFNESIIDDSGTWNNNPSENLDESITNHEKKSTGCINISHCSLNSSESKNNSIINSHNGNLMISSDTYIDTLKSRPMQKKRKPTRGHIINIKHQTQITEMNSIASALSSFSPALSSSSP